MNHYLNGNLNEEFGQDNDVISIYEDKYGIMWFGTFGKGLYSYNRTNKQISSYSHVQNDKSSISNNNVRVIHEDLDGKFWIGTSYGGINLMNRFTGTFSHYQHDVNLGYSLSNNDVYDIIEDRFGNLWIATWEGLNKVVYERNRFVHHQPRGEGTESLSHRLIMPIIESADGSLWVATLGGGLNNLNRKNREVVYYKNEPGNSNSLSNDYIWALDEDGDSLVWIGTWGGGLTRFDPSRNLFSHYVHDASDPSSLSSPTNRIYSIFGTKDGYLWIGTRDGGLNRFDKETEQFISYQHIPEDSSSISYDEVNPIYEDSGGVLWVGTYGGGLNRFDRDSETFTHYRNAPEDSLSISHDMITVITEYPAGTLWIGTFGGGLNKLDIARGAFNHYTTEDGLAGDIVAGILIDDEGLLWVSTNNNGLSRFDPESETFRNYDERDGLQSNTFHIGSYYKSESGEMFFGGANGFNSFFPAHLKDDPNPPDVVFTDLRIDGVSQYPHPDSSLNKAIAYTDTVIIRSDQREFSFEMAALHYKNPVKNQYRYKLEGYDEGWRFNGTDRETITFNNLPPRTYTLKAIASNSDGKWLEEDEAASVTIIVKPKWYETWLARFFYFVGAGLGVFGIVQWRLLAVRRDNERLERQVRERTAEVRDKNAQLEQQARQLLEMDRVKSTFFANISHEFRTPLTLIMGPVRDALEGIHGPLKASLDQHLRLVARSSESLKQLIDQLLDLSRLEAGQLHLHARCYNVAPFVQDIVTLFNMRAAPRRIALTFDAEEDDILLYVDREKLERILNNLLSNALKFTPDGGAIDVRLFSMQADDGQWAEISVVDTGEGIAPDVLPHIFDRFRQGDDSITRLHEGAGIGLALTKELVELHGGTIDAVSEPGQGSTFTVRIPLGKAHLPPESIVNGVDDYEPPSRSEASERFETHFDVLPTVEPPEHAPRILIVEDHKDVRAYVRAFLQARYRVAEADNGRDGVRLAREIKPDLIVSDVMMPEMDGFELCNTIKNEPGLEHIPIVMLTARASDESRLEGLKNKADAYLVKPFKGSELLTWVENLIDIRRELIEKKRLGPDDIVVDAEDARLIARVRVSIEARLDRIKVSDIADEIGLSQRQLNRRIDEITDLPNARAYLRFMRLERAAQLLEQQAGRVNEIAREVGYEDASFFTRIFRQAYGVTPRDYAQGERGDPALP